MGIWNITCMHSCSGQGTVIIKNGQPFKFGVFNSAPTAHFSMHSEDPPWHNGHHRTDIADFGLMPTKFLVYYGTIISWSCHNELNRCYRAKIGQIVLTVPSQHCLFQERLQNWALWTKLDTLNLKGCSLFCGTEPWPLHKRVWYFISA